MLMHSDTDPEYRNHLPGIQKPQNLPSLLTDPSASRFLVESSPSGQLLKLAQQGSAAPQYAGNMSKMGRNVSDNLAVAMAKTFRSKTKVRSAGRKRQSPQSSNLCDGDPPLGKWTCLRCGAAP